MKAILLLIASSFFMTLAWYGHLKFKHLPVWQVTLAAWGIAFFEYILQVPANRIGHAQFSVQELVTIREVIGIVLTVAFSILVMKEPFRWNYIIGFALMIAGVFIIFKK